MLMPLLTSLGHQQSYKYRKQLNNVVEDVSTPMFLLIHISTANEMFNAPSRRAPDALIAPSSPCLGGGSGNGAPARATEGCKRSIRRGR